MTELLDRTITALRTNHDDLAAVVPGLSEDQLAGPSGASEWTVAQVLSHLGSGAEIMLRQLSAAIAGEAPEDGLNETVWARWDAASPTEQAAGFLDHDTRLVEAFEKLEPAQRSTLRVDLGFLPEPATLTTIAGMRLSEVAQHAWDVRVAGDSAAALESTSARTLAELFATDLAFLLGFSAKPDAVASPVRLAADDVSILVEDDRVRVGGRAADPTATFEGPLEALVRLLAGRLKAKYTPAGVAVSGNVTLDELRRLFPGY